MIRAGPVDGLRHRKRDHRQAGFASAGALPRVFASMPPGRIAAEGRGSAMEVRSNPIVDRAEWERQRAAAADDPGHFHGGIAKRAIHWYDSRHAAWITFDEPAACWTGWSAASGEQLAPRDYDERHEPWGRAFDDDEPPHYGWFQGGLTNAAFNEVDCHVLAGHGDEAAFIVEGDHWDEAADAPVVSFPVSRARLLLETVKA